MQQDIVMNEENLPDNKGASFSRHIPTIVALLFLLIVSVGFYVVLMKGSTFAAFSLLILGGICALLMYSACNMAYVGKGNVTGTRTRNVVLVAIVYILLLSFFVGGVGFSKSNRYANAKIFLEECNYERAIELLETLHGYEDADELLECATYMRNGSYAAWIKKNQLREFVVPKNVTVINEEAFLDCETLVRVTLPVGLKEIKSRAFSDCKNLAEINIPDGVSMIGYQAFYACTSLTQMTLPNSLTSIGNRAFYDCIKLNNITFKGTAEQWAAVVKGTYWNYNVPASAVICTNGRVQIL